MEHTKYRPLGVRSRRGCPLLILAIAFTLLAGCSRFAVVYRTSDALIEYYADDYLELDSAQIASWRPNLSDALSRHRQEELPYLAAFFDAAYRGTQNGFDRDRVVCLMDQFEDLYRRHFRLAVGLAAPLLADLTPEQIFKLERKFAEEAADEAKQDPAAKARRDRKRAKRYAEAMDWWFGSLTAPQKRIIKEVTAAMPDTASSWDGYRNTKRSGLISMLKRDAGEKKIRRYLDDWLVEYRDLPADLRKARLKIREQIVQLFLRMDKSFTDRQRKQFSKRLTSIRDDFMSLQKRPRMASVLCATD
jgi:hypothetical protein